MIGAGRLFWNIIQLFFVDSMLKKSSLTMLLVIFLPLTSFIKMKKILWRKNTKMVGKCISMYSSLSLYFFIYTIHYFFIFHSVGGSSKSWRNDKGRIKYMFQCAESNASVLEFVGEFMCFALLFLSIWGQDSFFVLILGWIRIYRAWCCFVWEIQNNPWCWYDGSLLS